MASESNTQQEDDEDRISKIPDDVLCHILSSLDTHEAVQTTILSKRWNKFWTSLPNLEFHDKYFPTSSSWFESDCDPFMKFVDHVMLLRDSKDISKFSLSRMHRKVRFIAEDIILIYRWIDAAIEHNIVELDLSLVEPNGSKFELHHSLYTCTTLAVLKIESNCISYDDPPKLGCFPKLKVLAVTFTNPDSPDSIGKLFSCCPVLEDLAIYGYPGRDALVITISAPELKTLKICLSSNGFYVDVDPAYTFLIDAPKLENFSLTDPWFLSNYHLESGSSVVKAKIALTYCPLDYDLVDYADRTTALLGSIPNVQNLCFTAVLPEDIHLPTFDHLHELELCCPEWELLIEFLKKSPNLKHLILKNSGSAPDFCKEELERNLVLPPESPNCLVSSLETITIKQFNGGPYEMRIVFYLILSNMVLKTMQVYVMDPKYSNVRPKEELHPLLLMHGKASQSEAFKLEIFYDENWTRYTDDMSSSELMEWVQEDFLKLKQLRGKQVRLVKVVKE